MAILEAQGRIGRKLGRKPVLLFAALLVLVIGVLGYLAHYGQCEMRSRFCVVDVVGTRSEVGVTWPGTGLPWREGWAVYVSTQEDIHWI